MQKNTNKPPQGSLLLRLLGGGYLVYLAWDLFSADDPKIKIAAILFGLVGAALFGFSLYSLITDGYFYDKPEKPSEEE